MTINWSLLHPELSKKLTQLIYNLGQKNIKLVPYSGYRSVRDQNKLFMQSRTPQNSKVSVARLKIGGFPYLASQLESLPEVERGPRVTNVVGGFSWHNWGEAVDCYIEDRKGKPDWNADHPSYLEYGKEAESLGLTWGGSWKSFVDKPHIQLRKEEIHKLYKPSEIDNKFLKGD